jgi:hypothetical protein
MWHFCQEKPQQPPGACTYAGKCSSACVAVTSSSLALSLSETECFLGISTQRELIATRMPTSACAVRNNLSPFEMPCIVLSVGTAQPAMHEEIFLRA